MHEEFRTLTHWIVKDLLLFLRLRWLIKLSPLEVFDRTLQSNIIISLNILELFVYFPALWGE